jgi:hypothetical protein
MSQLLQEMSQLLQEMSQLLLEMLHYLQEIGSAHSTVTGGEKSGRLFEISPNSFLKTFILNNSLAEEHKFNL